MNLKERNEVIINGHKVPVGARMIDENVHSINGKEGLSRLHLIDRTA